MGRLFVQKQVHGYRQGHQLLAGSVVLAGRDQDTVDRLSDLAGPLRPGESFEPYLTAYPLPSEKFFVLARTFQDSATARSGCVRTVSVLIPMATWEEIESLDGMFAELVCPDTDAVAVEGEVTTAKQRLLEGVADARVIQLVDAVFLDRRPVVFFDCAESEAIAVRLLLALWPAERRRFSLCTFALAPRRLEDRFFDLVFAPSSARSRFLGSGHRRVGGSEHPRSGGGGREYRWAETVALRIFRSEDPSLAGLDTLGLLGSEEWGDRATLRVVSLWNELAARADGNPRAALGMLDILRSRKGRREEEPWERLEGVLVKAIADAAGGLPVEEAWEFLFALEEKVADGRSSAVLGERMEAGATKLAGRDPREALATLLAEPSRRLAAMHVVRGLADGVAGSVGFGELAQDLERLPSFVVANLMGSSSRFARGMVEGMNVGQGNWLDVFVRAFDAAGEGSKRVIRRQALLVVEGPVVEQAVPHLLADIAGPEVSELAVNVVEGRKSVSRTVNQGIWEAARATGDEGAVREAVMECSDRAAVDEFVLRTLEVNKADIEWLAARKGDRGRANGLLRALLVTARDEQIRGMPQSAARDMIGLLAADLDAGKHEITRILVLDLIRDEEALDLGFRTLAVLRCDEARGPLGQWLVRAGLSDARADDDRVTDLLGEFGVTLAATELVDAVTSSRASAERLSANLVAVAACAGDAWGRAIGEVERVSKRLVGRGNLDLGREGYVAWASMIREWKAESDGDVKTRVADLVYRFAVRLAKRAVSALIVETFPIVYESLPRARKRRERDALASLFSPYHIWWMGLGESEDGRKSAINELVRAFMNSRWPPADLIVTALGAGVEKKVVKRLRNLPRGERYIEEVRDDARRLGRGERTRVLKCLAARR